MSNRSAWYVFDFWFAAAGVSQFGLDGKPEAEKAWASGDLAGLPTFPGERG